MGLDSKIAKAVSEAGYTEPTKIQLKAIPKIVQGFDIRASAQTGTGKTAAFLLPALHRLLTSPKETVKGPRILILSPTRELAMQITEQAEKYSKHMHRVKTVCVVGGVPYFKQKRNLSRPYDILVATPGRLIDLMHRKNVDLSGVEMLVLDEADRMLDMGFCEPVEEIVAATPSSRQTLMFSATLEGNVEKLSRKLLNNPMELVVHADKASHDNIKQKLHYVDNLSHKTRLLAHILGGEDINSVIIFTSTKRHADVLVEDLHDRGHNAAALHGDMNQRQRTRTIDRLKDGKLRFLVATDVAARGIDVQSISHVINFDLPRNIEDYVHRIGRTGRAGNKGTALSFAAMHDAQLVKRIEKFTGQPIEVVVIEGFEPRGKPGGGSPRPRRAGGKRPFGGPKGSRPGGKQFNPVAKRRFNNAGAKPARPKAFRSR